MPGTEKMKYGIKKPYISSSLQVAPGVAKNRPENGALPSSNKYTWYEGMDYGTAYNSTVNAFFYGTKQEHTDERYTYQVQLHCERRGGEPVVGVAVGRASKGGARSDARARASGAIRLVALSQRWSANPHRERAPCLRAAGRDCAPRPPPPRRAHGAHDDRCLSPPAFGCRRRPHGACSSSSVVGAAGYSTQPSRPLSSAWRDIPLQSPRSSRTRSRRTRCCTRRTSRSTTSTASSGCPT